jgi:hypothetical protein
MGTLSAAFLPPFLTSTGIYLIGSYLTLSVILANTFFCLIHSLRRAS